MNFKHFFFYLSSFFLIKFVFVALCFISTPLIGGIHIPPKDDLPNNYANLPCTDIDKQEIYELIDTVANNTKWDLLVHNEPRLREIEKHIKYIHPLRFLGIIFANPEMKNDMRKICEDTFKRIPFISGLSDKFNNESIRRSSYSYLSDFTKDITSKEKEYNDYELKVYLDRKDWEGLVYFLTYGKK